MSDNQKHPAYQLEQLQYAGGDGIPTASVRLRIDSGDVLGFSSIGNGPIDAMCEAIGQAVTHPHTILKCQMTSTGKGSSAQARVTIRIKSGKMTYAAESTDTDIVRAAALAYIQALNMMVEVEE